MSKTYINYILIVFLIFQNLFSSKPKNSLYNNLTLNTTNTWYEFSLNNKDMSLMDYAWVGLITFKSKKSLQLTNIKLDWKGKRINSDQISASLYQKKELLEKPLPIEENLVCDGKWDKKNQQIVFKLNEKLVAVKKYYLLLSFPQKLKKQLKSGNFTLAKIDY